MTYLHAGGIDAPVALVKGGRLVLPLTDWRGQPDEGVCGAALCGDIDFPLGRATAYGDQPDYSNGPPSWYGSLLTGLQDGSGYQYRRNRYYDPKTGRFTQEDPIGLAGGMNAYGFANGDPVSFSDPFGLWPYITFPSLCNNEAQAAAFAGLKLRWNEIEDHWNEGVRDLSSLMAVGAGLEGLAVGGASAEAMGTRYMGAEEAAEVRASGVIPATNAAGRPRVIHYTADAPTMSAADATATYKLPTKPTHMSHFPHSSVRDHVPPEGAVVPGATQAATSQPINRAGRPIPLDP